MNKNILKKLFQALLRVPMSEVGVTARSTSLEELPSCVLEEAEWKEAGAQGAQGAGRPRSSNDIPDSAVHTNTLSNLSTLSGRGLSKSYNHSSVVRHSGSTHHPLRDRYVRTL